MDNTESAWAVYFTGKAAKQAEELPPVMRDSLLALAIDLRCKGPVQPEWHHYGKLRGKKDIYHCHLNKGKPRYVTVWQVTDKQIKVIEVRYVGTHENAPY